MTVKSGVLQILERQKGIEISGERLALELSCTRAAVWKAIRALQAEGYEITAGQSRGYRLSERSNFLSAEGVRAYLKDTEIAMEVLERTVSTNQEARRRALDENWPHGSVILARTQESGRGRRGRRFYSPEGGLYLSIILRPKTSIRESLLLTTAAATAVFRAVKRVCGIELSIKWVNDLYRENKKVCGILTEAVTDFESGEIEAAIVGIGLNLSLHCDQLPEELRDVITDLGPDTPDSNRLAAEIINEMMRECTCREVSAEYREHNIIPGRRICIDERGRSRTAYAVEICPDGRLKVREEDGRETLLTYGEVSVRREDL